MTAAIDALLGRITDPGLADQLRASLAQDRDREFGLVFEHHLPETVELPGMAIRAGAKVRMLPRRNTTEKVDLGLWIVTKIADQVAELVSPDGDQTAVRSVFDLVRVADFADPIYPGLEVTETLANGQPDDPWHVLIDAENYHALLALQFTHADAVDTIYIDPPYNTSNDDWIYSDRHIAPEDGFRHSKWLSFMERRLSLAKKLLKPTGVIICAIGDDEHHRLRMLMDQVFGEQNFISDVCWDGVRKNDSRFVSRSADYMLIYAKDQSFLTAADIRWSEAKPGLAEVISSGLVIWAAVSGEGMVGESAAREASKRMKLWWRSLPANHPARTNPGLAIYDKVEWRPGREGMVYRTLPLSSPSPRQNLMYDLPHPSGGICARPPHGWRWSEDVMKARIAAGDVVFGSSSSSSVQYKRYLLEGDAQTVSPVFTQDRAAGSGHLTAILGDKRFPFPKDHEVLMRWIGMVTPACGSVLDFFGGSGSTLEAVLRLNSQDGGTRQCILVTNNEVGSKREASLRKAGRRDGDPEWEAAGICEYVTKPRVRTILTGVRPDGSPWPQTVAGNVQFATLTYEDPALIELDLAFERVAPLLWLMAGAAGARVETIPAAGWAVVESYGVLFNLDRHAPFLEALTDQKVAFVVTDDEGQFQRIAAEIPPACRAVRLYESYLRSFQLQNEGV